MASFPTSAWWPSCHLLTAGTVSWTAGGGGRTRRARAGCAGAAWTTFSTCSTATRFSRFPAQRDGVCIPGLPSDWPSLEAPEYLCIPTPSALAYVAAHLLPRGRAESAEIEHRRGLVRAIFLCEWAVLALLCFLRAAHKGLPFFTKCPAPRLQARRDEPVGEGGVLFRLSAGLVALIRSV